MLGTARQLAAGLGAPAMKLPKPQPGADAQSQAQPKKVGNARLGLWVGERFLGRENYDIYCGGLVY